LHLLLCRIDGEEDDFRRMLDRIAKSPSFCRVRNHAASINVLSALHSIFGFTPTRDIENETPRNCLLTALIISTDWRPQSHWLGYVPPLIGVNASPLI